MDVYAVLAGIGFTKRDRNFDLAGVNSAINELTLKTIEDPFHRALRVVR
jgi:hypothetical protein